MTWKMALRLGSIRRNSHRPTIPLAQDPPYPNNPRRFAPSAPIPTHQLSKGNPARPTLPPKMADDFRSSRPWGLL